MTDNLFKKEVSAMVNLYNDLVDNAPLDGKLAVIFSYCRKHRISISNKSFGCADKNCPHRACPWHPKDEEIAVNC